MNKEDAIRKINPSAIYVIRGLDIDTCEITWLDGTTPISKADIKAKMAEFEYINKRKKEYPLIEDQLDDIYHNGIDAWKATIKVTKDKYPKE
jgi:hypothetical protein